MKDRDLNINLSSLMTLFNSKPEDLELLAARNSCQKPSGLRTHFQFRQVLLLILNFSEGRIILGRNFCKRLQFFLTISKIQIVKMFVVVTIVIILLW